MTQINPIEAHLGFEFDEPGIAQKNNFSNKIIKFKDFKTMENQENNLKQRIKQLVSDNSEKIKYLDYQNKLLLSFLELEEFGDTIHDGIISEINKNWFRVEQVEIRIEQSINYDEIEVHFSIITNLKEEITILKTLLNN